MPIREQPSFEAQRDPELDERLSKAVVTMGIAGASIALLQGDKRRCAAAGFANMAADIEADTRTIFQVGSITKVYTATLAMMLHEYGLLDIDAPVSNYLPDLIIDGRPAPARLTTRTLLDYTSGIAGEFFEDFGCGSDALERYVTACAALPFVFEHGTMRGYSSTGYCIAGRVIEAVTGQSYNEALSSRLLVPLGTERFAFFGHDVARFRTAVGHEPDSNGSFKTVDTLRLPHCMSASGASLTTTANDLLRFAELHLNCGVGQDGNKLLSPTSCEEMIKAERRLPPGASPVLMGWTSIELEGATMIAASGQTVGQNAFAGFIPAAGVAISILTNVTGGAQRLLMTLGAELISETTGLQLKSPQQTPVTGTQTLDAKRYVGHYTNHTRALVEATAFGLDVTLTAKETTSDKIVSQTLSLAPIGGDMFVAGPPDAPIAIFRFLFEKDGAASHFAYAGSVFARCDLSGRTGIQP